jgi:hypothetical protein
MPLELQELAPKPDLDATGESTQIRVPKLAVRGRSDGQSPTVASTTPSSPTVTAFTEKGSKESLRSSDDVTISPPSLTSTTDVAPWEKEQSVVNEHKMEPRPATTHSASFTTSTNERHSSDVSKQPFRHEVSI